MKKVIFAVAIVSAAFVACNSSDADKKATDSPVVVTPPVVVDTPAKVIVVDTPAKVIAVDTPKTK